MPHHEIKIHLARGVVKTEKDPVLHVGDTVRYSSPDGKARVVFPSGSPYAVSHLDDAQSQTLETPGKFPFQCFVTPAGQTEEIGWNAKNPQAGGVHDVHPA